MSVEWITTSKPVAYPDALSKMDQRVADIIEQKADEAIWLLEHPPLYTAGTGAQEHDLLNRDQFPVFEAGRGGQFTYHGPGQRVAYTMLDLRKRGKDIRQFIHNLEETIIRALETFGIKGERREGRVGVWVFIENGQEAKIAAIGVRVRRWVSFHGVSININPDLRHYEGIIPCGIQKHGVTSMEQLGCHITMDDFDTAFQSSFEDVFS